MKFFLSIKHWQLFLLQFMPPAVLIPWSVNLMLAGHKGPNFFIVFAVTTALSAGLLFGWLYSVGTFLHPRLPFSQKMNLNKFRLLLLIPFAYIGFVLVFILAASATVHKGTPMDNSYALWIVPLHLFSMFCIFYSLYFTAKSLVAVELQESVIFSDFSGEFFLMWFFPVGIWFVQPRINKIFAASRISEKGQAPV